MMELNLRTHYCTQITEDNINEEVQVAGWVNSRRDHGGLIFIDLRDKGGLIQLVCDPALNNDSWKIANLVRDEFILIAKLG